LAGTGKEKKRNPKPCPALGKKKKTKKQNLSERSNTSSLLACKTQPTMSGKPDEKGAHPLAADISKGANLKSKSRFFFFFFSNNFLLCLRFDSILSFPIAETTTNDKSKPVVKAEIEEKK
jgi:hypothetical protein